MARASCRPLWSDGRGWPGGAAGRSPGGLSGGVVGELADIADLAVLAEQAYMAWTILVQGAKELHDKPLVEVASQARDHSRRQLSWLRTQIEHEAPDAIAVAHDAKGQAR